MLKFLRIAVTALSLTACVLLIALWVRSYYRGDDLRIPLHSQRTLSVDSLRGRLIWHVFDSPPHLHHLEWVVTGIPVGDSKAWSDYDSQIRAWHWIHMGGPDPEALVLPHWFFVLITGALAGLPWLAWKFSLRTLLIATTLVAVGLVAIIWAAR